ncbi:MAG: hypothetical protein RBT49_00225 [Bacteroidales bacterium]|jgi:hypothetical protein|nr:hypothetical protein [Bacteroidales bacterium]
MKKMKLNSLASSMLKDSKLNDLEKLSNNEKRKIFGGVDNHRVSSKCTTCKDDMCDSQYVNDHI